MGHLLRDLDYFTWIKIYRHYNLNIEIFLSRLKVFELLSKILLSLLKLSFGLVFVIIQQFFTLSLVVTFFANGTGQSIVGQRFLGFFVTGSNDVIQLFSNFSVTDLIDLLFRKFSGLA